MTNTNVLEFAPALQRRRERNESTARSSRQGPWRNRYREGIDGLWTKKSTGEVVQLAMARKRLTALRIDETHNG